MKKTFLLLLFIFQVLYSQNPDSTINITENRIGYNLYNAGFEEFNKGNYDKAADLYRKAYDSDTLNTAFIKSYVNAMIFAEHFDECRDFLERTFQKLPETEFKYIKIAECIRKSDDVNDLDKAIDYLEQGTLINNHNLSIKFEKGVIYLKLFKQNSDSEIGLENLKKSEKYLTEIYNEKNYNEVFYKYYYFDLLETLKDIYLNTPLRDLEKAKNLLDELLVLEDFDLAHHIELARIYAILGDPFQGIKILEKAYYNTLTERQKEELDNYFKLLSIKCFKLKDIYKISLKKNESINIPLLQGNQSYQIVKLNSVQTDLKYFISKESSANIVFLNEKSSVDTFNVEIEYAVFLFPESRQIDVRSNIDTGNKAKESEEYQIVKNDNYYNYLKLIEFFEKNKTVISLEVFDNDKNSQFDFIENIFASNTFKVIRKKGIDTNFEKIEWFDIWVRNRWIQYNPILSSFMNSGFTHYILHYDLDSVLTKENVLMAEIKLKEIQPYLFNDYYDIRKNLIQDENHLKETETNKFVFKINKMTSFLKDLDKRLIMHAVFFFIFFSILFIIYYYSGKRKRKILLLFNQIDKGGEPVKTFEELLTPEEKVYIKYQFSDRYMNTVFVEPKVIIKKRDLKIKEGTLYDTKMHLVAKYFVREYTEERNTDLVLFNKQQLVHASLNSVINIGRWNMLNQDIEKKFVIADKTIKKNDDVLIGNIKDNKINFEDETEIYMSGKNIITDKITDDTIYFITAMITRKI